MIINRNLLAAELATILEWAALEGWNPGLDDGAAFLATDPQGFFGCEVDGELVAAISLVNHGQDDSFLGLYLCRPEWRGQGLGFALWQHALLHAGRRSIGLDGVAAQQANYARSGFVLTGATTRYEGSRAALIAGCPAPSTRPIRTAANTDLPALIRLDATANGYERAQFVAQWMGNTATRQTLVVEEDSGEGDGALAGCVTVRRCREGVKIGPLIAADLQTAHTLLAAAVALFEDADQVQIDLPAHQPAFADWLRTIDFHSGFATARMYRGRQPVVSGNLFAIATMELG